MLEVLKKYPNYKENKSLGEKYTKRFIQKKKLTAVYKFS
jgi:hypothetical protein